MAPLSPDAKRLRTIIISLPVLVVTSAILYRRAFLGEEQRRIPQATSVGDVQAHDKILGPGASDIGGAPWQPHVHKADSGR